MTRGLSLILDDRGRPVPGPWAAFALGWRWLGDRVVRRGGGRRFPPPHSSGSPCLSLEGTVAQVPMCPHWGAWGMDKTRQGHCHNPTVGQTGLPGRSRLTQRTPSCAFGGVGRGVVVAWSQLCRENRLWPGGPWTPGDQEPLLPSGGPLSCLLLGVQTWGGEGGGEQPLSTKKQPSWSLTLESDYLSERDI